MFISHCSVGRVHAHAQLLNPALAGRFFTTGPPGKPREGTVHRDY